jgi:hypothetical protein
MNILTKILAILIHTAFVILAAWIIVKFSGILPWAQFIVIIMAKICIVLGVISTIAHILLEISSRQKTITITRSIKWK